MTLSAPSSSSPPEALDVVIVGGSFAGLAAATMLGRARRRVVVLDGGEPRNRFAAASHGFLAQDGASPAAILGTAREQLAEYTTVRLVSDLALGARREENGFVVRSGGETYRTRRLLLAQGVRDTLPAVEGLRERWGEGVFHCPYCHGYELRDLPLGVLGAGPMAVHQAVLLRDWSPDVVVFADGGEFSPEELRILARRGVPVETAPVARLHGEGRHLSEIELADGRRIARRGLLIRSRVSPNGTFHEDLGLEMTETPVGVVIGADAMGMTSVPGVFAAGDVGVPMQSVPIAVAAGARAAASAHRSLLQEDWS